MIKIKNDQQIQYMREGGKILAETLWQVMDSAKPGVSEKELDTLAERLIREKGGEPGFQKVPGYHHATCISTNDVVVHGIPTDYVLKDGDVLGIDCGVFYKGFHTDMSESKIIGKVKDKKHEDFLKTGKRALEEAIQVAVVGNHIGEISKTIQDIVEKECGYSIVRSLVGHGVGKELHEEPEVPGFLRGTIAKTPILQKGMVIAIEVIYNMGGKDVVYSDDGWTIKSRDGSISGLFERTVAILDSKTEVLT